MLTKLKIALSALAGIAIAVLYALLGREKVKSAEREEEIAKSSQEASEKATEALVKGMSDENKPVNRGYFDK